MARKLWTQFDFLVNRERTDAMFDAGMVYPLITVVAGPGYGKTTAAYQYAQKTNRKLIWHHLLPIDNDPDCFWDRMAEAVGRELPELGKTMAKTKFPAAPGGFYFFLKDVASVLFQDTEILLVYDSAENISNEMIFLFFDSLIKAELENLCIIYISNVRPQLGYLVCDGQHLQIGPAELQFNQHEIMQLFKKYDRLADKANCAELMELTGGWPLALHLMASHPSNKANHAFGETPHFHVIAELFHQNYFIKYKPAFQDLLIKLSFFDAVPLGLIHALDGENAPHTVEQLTKNIFISYDYSQSCFYFQRMYHDFLKQKQAMLSNEKKEEIFSSAGRWFYDNELYLQAMLCHWEIRDYDHYLRAMASLPRKRRSRRSANAMLEQLNQFPDDYVREHELVDYYRGLLYMNNWEISHAQKILLPLIARLEKQEPSPEKLALLGNAYTAMIGISFAQNKLEGLEYASKALGLVSQGIQISFDNSIMPGNNGVFFLPDNAPGQLNAIFDFLRRFSVLAKDLYGKDSYGFIELFAAEAFYMAQRFGDVREYGTKAIIMAKEAGQHEIVVNGYTLLLREALFHADYVKAEEILQKIVDYAEQTAAPEIYPLRDCALGMFYIRMGDLAKVPLWLSEGGRLPTDINLDVGRDKIVCALYRFLNGHYEAAYTTLLELDSSLLERNLWSMQLISHILKAACLYRMGNMQKAVQALWSAYDMTWQNDITVCFAEFGDIMEPLIAVAHKQDELQFDAQWLKDVAKAAVSYSRRISAAQKLYKNNAAVHKGRPDALTARELEILQYLSNGLTRNEISSLLEISLHGVKKHITNIYDKLGAVNRIEAVHIAQSSSLLN